MLSIKAIVIITVAVLLCNNAWICLIPERTASSTSQPFSDSLKDKFEPRLWDKVQQLKANGTLRLIKIDVEINCTLYKDNKTAAYEFRQQIAEMFIEQHNATILYVAKVLNFVDIEVNVTEVENVASYDFVTYLFDLEVIGHLCFECPES